MTDLDQSQRVIKIRVSANDATYFAIAGLIPMALALCVVWGNGNPIAFAVTPAMALYIKCGSRTFGNGQKYYWLRQTAFASAILYIFAGAAIYAL